MKITNLSNVEGFLKTVSECKGTVELVTKEGDRLNLKSELTKYVALTSFFKDSKIPEMEVILSEPDDAVKIINFLQ
ncbi:MAG: polya polymerase [Lachnospiraceae bacterium]|nr:polya polymerase [Lachnospiraceae bacterium]MBS7328985.1 polya polymerase [Lachnospiraceae bacterium]MCI7557234.1 polya polymerase [Lachnospiraceae bacterium]MDD6011100.1 polya polymerase [Lachnospiraceae bacterium]MDD7548423.1 polya polymerase [Lachnospiraceae bacterium]